MELFCAYCNSKLALALFNLSNYFVFIIFTEISQNRLDTQQMKNKLIVTVLLSIGISFSFGQNNALFRYNSIYAGVTYNHAYHYNGPFIRDQIQTGGGKIGVSLGMFEEKNIRLEWKMGYRFIKHFADGDAIGMTNLTNNLTNVYNYHGGFTGPTICFGNIHALELTTLLGGGKMIRKNPKNTNWEMETNLQVGYRYQSNNGLMLRAGAFGFLGRNGFFSPMYGAYFSAGYAFAKKTGTIKNQSNKGGYFAIMLRPYLGSLTFDLIGTGVQFDHFLLNGEAIDLGYTLIGRSGFNYDTGTSFSVTPAMRVLAGKSAHKFDLSLGVNWSSTYNYWEGTEIYELIHFGLGYRWVSQNTGLTFGVGSSTTSLLNGTIGFTFGKNK